MDVLKKKKKTKRKKTTKKNWACQNQKFLEDVRKFSLSTMCSLVMPHSVISCGVDLLIQFFCHNYHHPGLAYPIHLLRPENFKNVSSSAGVYCFQMAFNIFNFLNECFTCKWLQLVLTFTFSVLTELHCQESGRRIFKRRGLN